MARIALARCPYYDPARVEGAVQEAIRHLGGIEAFVKPGDRVLLKPNVLAGTTPERAVTTHPTVLRAVIRAVRSGGSVPLVGDCSAHEGPPSRRRFLSACQRAGIRQVCDEEGVELVHLSGDAIDVANPNGRAFQRFTIAKQVLECDVLVTLPKLKTHALTLFTGAVKNSFGCIPGMHKAQLHLRASNADAFAQMLVDLLALVRPSLTVMDAIVGMEGNGPQNGRPRAIGAVIAGTDPVAVDTVACQIVGIRPEIVPTIRLAHEQRLGIGDPASVELLGEPLQGLIVSNFQLPSGSSIFSRAPFLRRFARDLLTAKPALADDRCQGCWLCVEHCPTEALAKNGRRPIFAYDKCIRCYCCQEHCPHDAIMLREPILARLLAR